MLLTNPSRRCRWKDDGNTRTGYLSILQMLRGVGRQSILVYVYVCEGWYYRCVMLSTKYSAIVFKVCPKSRQGTTCKILELLRY